MALWPTTCIMALLQNALAIHRKRKGEDHLIFYDRTFTKHIDNTQKANAMKAFFPLS